MGLNEQIIPALVILVANLFGGNHSSTRWELVTAIFGWLSIIGLLGWIIVSFFVNDKELSNYFIQLAGFFLITAIARDYEKRKRVMYIVL